jgi:tetratricopeptide (TPR) repeat protein
MSERRRELFEAVVQNPNDREASDALEGLLLEGEFWTDFINLQIQLVEHSTDPAEASARLVGAADVAAQKLGDARQAVELLGASLEGDPSGGLQSLAQMRRLLLELEEWEDYLQVAEAEADRIEAAEPRAALIFEMGEVLEQRVGDPERAMVCYEAAFGQDPGCKDALWAAQRLYKEAGNAEMTAQLLDVELQSDIDDARRAEVLQALGNILLYDLEQPDLARRCFTAFLGLRPDDEETTQLLTELGGPLDAPIETGPPDAAAPVPEAQDAPDAPAAPEPEAVAEPEAPTEPEAAEPEAAEPEAAAQPEAADVVELPAAEADDRPTEALPELDIDEPAAQPDVALEGEGAEHVAALYADAIALEGDARLAGLIEAGLASREAGGAGPLAEVYLAAVALDPVDVTLYWRVAVGLKASEVTLQAIASGLEAAAAAADPEDAPCLTAHHLMFQATTLDDARGLDFKLRDLVKKSGDPAVAHWQIQRLVETAKWRNIQQIIVQQIGGDPATARTEAIRQMAVLAEERAGDVTKAADFWRQVNQADREDVPSREALLRLYPEVGKWKEYAEILEIEVNSIPDSDVEAKTAGIRKLLATLNEHLRADQKVVALYKTLLTLDPDDTDAMAVLVAKYEAMRKWPDLVQVLEMQAERSEGEARIGLMLKIAHLYLEKFRNQAEAIKAFEGVLAEDPDCREAIEALDGMYEKRRDWDRLVEVRSKLADMQPEPEARLAAYKALADYATKKIRRPGICLALWEQVREIHSDDVDALRALVGFYEQDKNWASLTETVDQLVGLVDGDKERIDLLQKSGIVLQERVGDRAAAVGAWKQLLEVDPNHRRAGDSLKKALIELGEWDELTAFFAQREKWDELVRLLEGQVGVQKDDAVRIDLLFRSASIWSEQIGQQDRAVRSLERVLQLEPDNLSGARALEPIYSEHADYRKLANVLEVLLGHEADALERRALMLRSAEINEKHLRNVEGAFEWTRRVVEEHPADAEARAELERLGGLTQQWATVHDEFQVALEKVEAGAVGDADPTESQLALLLSLARILDEEMGAFEDALSRYLQALDLDGESRVALDAVEAIYTRMANWPELLGVLDRKLAVADDVEARKGLLRKQGAIFEEQLEDAYSAIERYRSIVEEDEGDREALEALHRLYEHGEQYEDLHEVMLRELQLEASQEGGDPLRLKMAVGRIELEHLGQTAEAVAQFRDILEQQPEHVDARQALEGLLGDGDFRAQVAGILEPIYRDASEWTALVNSLEIQLEETAETAKRVEFLERIGTLHVDRVADIEQAFGAFARMLREQPDSRIGIQRLTELADVGDRWEPLANLLEEVVPDVSDDELGRALLARLAGIYEEQLLDVPQAIDAHRRVLDLKPDETLSIEALDRLYQRSQQWPELLLVYRTKLELSEDPFKREALQFQIAELLENMLGDAPESIQTYRDILEGSAENGQALAAVSRLYAQEEMWPELADALGRQLELASDDDTRITLQVRLGVLHERELGNIELAIETYRAVLEADPVNADVVEALERLIDEPDQRAAVADLLEPIYERQDAWQQLVGVFEIQREEAVDEGRKVELLHRIALLHQERGNDPAEAFRSYARAFQVEPGDARTLGHLHRLAEALDCWGNLVEVYRGEVYDISDIAVATDVHKRVAKVLLEQVQDIEGARSHYESAYENDDTEFEVIEALEDIYTQTQQWEELVSTLLRKSELVEAPADKKDLFFRISAIHEDMLGDQERAVESFTRVLEVDDVDAQALGALERIFLSLERWEDLLEVLHKKAALQGDLAAKKDIYYVIGGAYEQELDDLQRAVETYRQILEWDADDQKALECLDGLYNQLEDWDSLLEILGREVAVAEDVETQLGYRFRVAGLHEAQLDDVITAIEGYASILGDAPEHEPTLVALETLVQQDREARAAADVLQPVLTQGGAWTRQISVWRALLEVTVDLEARVALLLQLGHAQEDMLADSDAAFGAYGEAFREEPGVGETLTCLERVAQLATLWPELVGLIEGELGNVGDDQVLLALYLRVARIFEEELGDNVEAIERFRRVLEIDPDHEGAILALDRLYLREGMWADLAEVLQLEVERAEDTDRVPLLLRLGTLQEANLEDVPQAINAYRDTLDLQAQQPDAVANLERLFAEGQEQPVIGEMLEPIYLENEDWPQLHDLLQALLAHQMAGDDRMRAMHRLAELSQEQLADVSRAFDWYGAAFREVPEDERSHQEAARLAEETGRWPDLVVVYTEGLQQTQDLELIREVSHEMAVIYREKLGDDASAEQMYRYILDGIDPSDTTALQGLDELLEGQQRWPELVEILQREVEATFEPDARVAYMFRLGQAFESALGQIEDAVEQYQGILDQEPNHEGALARLEQIHLAQGSWDPLFEIYNRQTENATDDAGKARLYAQMANLASEFLERPEDAVDLWNQVLEINREDPQALLALEGLYQSAESWRELVDVCERQVNVLDAVDAEREIELYAKLGRVWGDYLEREENALENWHKVLERQPHNVDALWAVKGLYERTEANPSVAETNHRLLALLSPEDPTRLDLYRQLGTLYQEVLEQDDDAIAAWTNVLAISSHDPEAIDALEELYAGAENWASCVEVLDRKAEITEDSYERVSILFRIAEMYEEKLQDVAGAQGAYVRVLEVQADSIDAFEQLERLYEAGEQWEELVNLLLSRLEHTEDAYERQEAFQRIAVVFETRLDLADNAFLVLGQGFEESRDDERFGAELERLAAVTEKWAELITLYEGVLQVLGTAPESVPIHLRVATWYDEKLEQAQHAGTHYQYVLAIEPDNIAALTALELLLERYENWPKVAEVLQTKIDLLVEPDERKASLQKLAKVLESRLDRSDEAVEAYQQVVQIDGGDLETLQSLERLFLLRQRWEDLIEVLDQQTALMEDEQAIVELHLRAGELWEARMGAPERAIDAYNQALTVDERCLDAMQALEKLYTQQDRWHDLLDVYEMMLVVRTEPASQARIYTRIAMIQEEELSDVHATIDTYEKMAVVDARDPVSVRALDRLYRETERWDDLATVYERHLEVLEDDQEKIGARTTLAEIYAGPIGDHLRAVDALKPVLEIDDKHRATLAKLGELYAELEDWHACIDALGREAHLIHDRVELLSRQCKVGRIYQEHVGDLEKAERWFQSALEHDPNHLPALDALKDIYEARGEWNEVVRVRKMMEAANRSFPEKSKHLYAIGKVYDLHLGDQVTAIDFYEQALDLDPENVDAAEPLVEVYWTDQRWERAEPLFDLMLAARASQMELREQQELNYRVAFCADKLHKEDKALTHYRHAYELDSTHLPTLQGMGALLYDREDWDRAFKIFQTILVHHRESLGSAAIVDVFHRQGGIKLKVGERRKALDFYRKALDIDPQHVATLEAIVALHESQSDWDDVIHYRRKLVGLSEDPGRKFSALVSMAEILHEHMRNPRLAVEAYEEALQVQPGSKMVYAKLLGLHEEAGNWQQAVEVLSALAEMEGDARRQAKYFYAVAAIQRDYIKDSFTAVRTFDKALDADPAMLKAFQAIDQILTNERDFERQDRYYRKMLKRATETQMDDALVIKLAKALGEINRSRLQRYDEAIKAYRIALAKSPQDIDAHGIVAQLYELEGRVDKAIGQYYRLIELNPRNIESYQNLRRLFMDNQRFDEAWCVCQVLYYLGHASPDERAFFEKYRSRTLTQARRPLDKQHWALINHPEKSPLLDQLVMRLYRYTVPLMTKTHKELGIHKRRDAIDASEQTPFNNVLNYASQITRLQRLECFKGPQGQVGIRSANLNPPAMLVGRDVLSGPKLQELAFISAKQLYMMGQQHFISTIDESYEMRKSRLQTIVYTLIKTITPQAQVPFHDENLLLRFQQIPAHELTEMAKLIQKMQANPQQHLNLSKWFEMLEHSANRLGMLLANDIGAAMQVVRNESGTFSRAPTQDRIREVVLFALSENYFQLRKALGLAIG